MGNGLQRAGDAARATRGLPPAPRKKITYAKAKRLVAVIAELQECVDCPSSLSLALEDARAEISPFYDGKD